MANSAQPAFRIDVAINDLLIHSGSKPPAPPAPKGAALPEPVFPQHPGMLSDAGPETPPENAGGTGNRLCEKPAAGWFPTCARA